MIRKMLEKFRKNKASNKGFTLVELLVAIAILAVVVVPTLQVFVTSTKTNSKARTKLQATITADSVLESVKSFPIYLFDSQCRASYDGSGKNTVTGEEFTMLPGRVINGSNVSFTSSTYGGTVGVLQLDPDGSIVGVKSSSELEAEPYDKNNLDDYDTPGFAYVLSGIKQSNNKYDAVVYIQRSNFEAVETDGGTYDDDKIASIYPTYKKEYKITVYVYKHTSEGAYIDEILTSEDEDATIMRNAIVYVNGSKLDTADKQ